MATIQHTVLRDFGAAIFKATGNLPEDQCRAAIDHLVDSNLSGHDSHGIIRLPSYTKSLIEGGIKAVNPKVERESPGVQVWDANRSFGIVLCRTAMQTAVDMAKDHSFGAVGVYHSSHIGRLGDFPPLAAEQGCIGALFLNGGGHFTAPFGGTSRRLPPNPISISVPTPGPYPMMLDMTTSMAAGGKVSVYAARGQQVPEGWLVDEDGNTVTDPNRFRGDDPVAMLPLGGPSGHKGYGLGMMVEALAALTWSGVSAAEPTRGGRGYLALAIKIESFIDLEEYKKEMGILIDWVKSSKKMPGNDHIYFPGEIEAETRKTREADGIYLEDPTWNAILATAEEMGVTKPEV